MKDEWKTCKNCNSRYHPSLNCVGECLHSGEWHDTFDKCSYMKCGWNLGIKNVGKCHYSCCFSTQHDSLCDKSHKHVT